MHKTPAAVTYYYIWFHNVTVNQLELSTTTGARLCTQNVAKMEIPLFSLNPLHGIQKMM